MNLKIRLICSLIIILFLGFSLTHIINYKTTKNTLHENLVNESLPIISNNIYSEIQRDIMRPIHISSLMSIDTFVKDWMLEGEKDIKKIQKYLLEIKKDYDFNSTFLISCKTLNYYHFKGFHKKISPQNEHDDWYYTFLKQKEDYDLDVDTDEAASNNLTIFINHRLEDYEGNLIGVTGVGLSMKEVGSLLAEYQGEFKRNIYLVDPRGVVQVHSDIDQIQNVNIFQQEGIQQYKLEIVNSKDEKQFFEFDRKGKHILLLTRFIPEFNWYLFVEQDETYTFAHIRMNLIRNLIIGFLITFIVIIINVITVNYFQSKLEFMATIDPLTEIDNRKSFQEKVCAEMNRCHRYHVPMTLLMLDLDHFKTVNDSFGHMTGDHVLKRFVKECRINIRDTDIMGRMGGEEFAILLVETNMDDAMFVAERILNAVSDMIISRPDGEIKITVSIGMTPLSVDEQSFDQLIQQADQALYKAKNNGRNRIEIVEAESEPMSISIAE